MRTADPNKIRISREILSGGPGYKAFRTGWHWRGREDLSKRHMGRYVRMAYIPTAPEWEPPAHLLGKWWEIVNEAGNTVGLKAYIPPPGKRGKYENRKMDKWSKPPSSRDWPSLDIRWPWTRARPKGKKSKLMVRKPSLVERLGLLRWLPFLKRKR